MAPQTDVDHLDRVRARIAELRDQRAELDRQPYPREAAIAALERWIQTQAVRFHDELDFRNPLNGRAPARLAPISFADGAPDWTATLCALEPDAIRSAFVAKIDEALADAAPLSDEERAEQRQAIADELGELEREEEALVQRLHAAGEPAQRRPDADPAAVLGLAEPPRAPEPPKRQHYITRYRDSAGRQVVHHHRDGDGA